MWNPEKYTFVLDHYKLRRRLGDKEIRTKEDIYKILSEHINVSVDTLKSWARRNSSGPGDEDLKGELEHALFLEKGSLSTDDKNDKKGEIKKMNRTVQVSDFTKRNIFYCWKVMRWCVISSELELIDFVPPGVSFVKSGDKIEEKIDEKEALDYRLYGSKYLCLDEEDEEIYDYIDKIIGHRIDNLCIGEGTLADVHPIALEMIEKKRICMPVELFDEMVSFLNNVISPSIDRCDIVRNSAFDKAKEEAEKLKVDSENYDATQPFRLKRDPLMSASSEILEMRYELNKKFEEWSMEVINPYLAS